MKNLTLTYKISIGFVLLLLITLILGSMAIVNMKSVEGGSQKLAMQIFGVIEQDMLKDGLTINVNLPDFLKEK